MMESLDEIYTKLIDTVFDNITDYGDKFKEQEDYAGVEVTQNYKTRDDFQRYFDWLLERVSDENSIELLPVPESLFTIVEKKDPEDDAITTSDNKEIIDNIEELQELPQPQTITIDRNLSSTTPFTNPNPSNIITFLQDDSDGEMTEFSESFRVL